MLLARLDQQAIAKARDLLLECYRRPGRVYTAGNGGSASTAQHFACDLAKFIIPAGARPFDVRCLTDNIALYTAWANDAARPEDVFVNQLRGPAPAARRADPDFRARRQGLFRRPGPQRSDTPTKWARRRSRWSGSTGGMLHQESACSILVPADSTPQTEAIHLVIEHLFDAVAPGRACPRSGPLMEVLCVGHAAWDISVFLPAYPAENSKAEIDSMLECGGGPAANAACLLSRWKIRTALAASLGDDAYAERIVRELSDAGTDVSLVRRSPEDVTPVLRVILVNQSSGSRTIVNRKLRRGGDAAGHSCRRRAWDSPPAVLLFDGHRVGGLAGGPGAISPGQEHSGRRFAAGRDPSPGRSRRLPRQLGAVRAAMDRACRTGLARRPAGRLVAVL